MFQKIAKHRANDASNDVHRPPLQGPQDIWTTSLIRLILVLQNKFCVPLDQDFENHTSVLQITTLQFS